MRSLMLALALVTGVCLSAHAADVDPAQLRQLVAKKERANVIVAGYRDARCPIQPTKPEKDACVAAFNMIIALRTAQIAEINFWLKAVELGPRDKLLVFGSIAPVAQFNRVDEEITAMGNNLDVLYPADK